MGSGNDLTLYTLANQTTNSYTVPGNSFALPAGVAAGTVAAYTYLTGGTANQYFTVADLEVYLVLPYNQGSQ
jgi:hypothetical protein